jgi:hypothetical protein
LFKVGALGGGGGVEMGLNLLWATAQMGWVFCGGKRGGGGVKCCAPSGLWGAPRARLAIGFRRPPREYYNHVGPLSPWVMDAAPYGPPLFVSILVNAWASPLARGE